MTSYKVLYIGADSGNSRARKDGLCRLGHSVMIIDPGLFLPQNRLVWHWVYRTGAFVIGEYVRKRALSVLQDQIFDLIIVANTMLVSPGLVTDLRRRCKKIINVTNDDPYGGRDGSAWRLHLKAHPIYDVIVVFREVKMAGANSFGARRVL